MARKKDEKRVTKGNSKSSLTKKRDIKEPKLRKIKEIKKKKKRNAGKWQRNRGKEKNE